MSDEPTEYEAFEAALSMAKAGTNATMERLSVGTEDMTPSQIVTEYRDAWLSIIYNSTGDYEKSKRAIELAEINGLFDPIEKMVELTITRKGLMP